MIANLPVSNESLDVLVHAYVRDPWMQSGLALLLLGTFAWIANWVAKRIVLKLLLRLLNHLPFQIEAQHIGAIVARLSNIVPALVIQVGIGAVPHLPQPLHRLHHPDGGHRAQRVPGPAQRPLPAPPERRQPADQGLCAAGETAGLRRRRDPDHRRADGSVATAAVRPWRHGGGADAGVQGHDPVAGRLRPDRVQRHGARGDWIEMPQFNADGDVIDIALHTVKIQNFDKTITTVPTHRLISESFRNWHGMAESGGRRIMRSLMIDQRSVRFLDEDAIQRMEQFAVLRPYLQAKRQEIESWNVEHGADGTVNGRRLTNIGTFRAYVLAYLQAHSDIAQDKTLLVRQLAPSENGLLMEIYAFASSTVWSEYEGTHADIFDHLLAILPDFGLRLFQRPAGADLAALAAA